MFPIEECLRSIQQTPKRQGQQTMRRLLPACSAFTKPRAHSPTANNLTFISQEGITAMPSMKSPPDTVGQVGWLLSPHDIQMHVGFQQTPKRQGQQTMGRLLPACSAFTNPPSSLSYCQQLDNYQSRGNSNYAIFYTPPLTGGKVRWLL